MARAMRVAFSMSFEAPVETESKKSSSLARPARSVTSSVSSSACVIADPKRGLFIKCADALIEVKELQFPGSKRMEAKAALNGKRLLGMVAGQ